MALRQKTKEPSSFLVYFENENEYFVAKRSRILYDGEVCKGVYCKVQRGTDPTDVADGCITACGNYAEIRKEMTRLLHTSPPAKRQKRDITSQEPFKKVKKPKYKQQHTAKVLRRVSPAKADVQSQDSAPSSLMSESLETDQLVNMLHNLESEVTSVLHRSEAETKSVNRMLTNLNKRFDRMEQNLARIESKLDLVLAILHQHRLSKENSC